MEKINWGIIGCGDVTEVKSGPAFNLIEDSELIAVMRREASKAEDYAKRHNVPKWYSDADKLINDKDVNAIYIATPPSSHAEYTIKAAVAGKPVYVEKPMAANYSECLEMIKVCKKNNVPLFTAYYRRELPYFKKIKELIDTNLIGRIRTVNIKLHHKIKEADKNKASLPWRVIPEIAGGGYFYDLAAHQLDYLDLLFGPIKIAEGIAVNQSGLYQAEDNVQAAFKFSNEVIGSGSWSFNINEYSQIDRTEIIGSVGQIEFSFFDRLPITVVTEDGEDELMEIFPENIQEPLIRTVVAALTGKGICQSTGESGARTNWVMDKFLGKI